MNYKDKYRCVGLPLSAYLKCMCNYYITNKIIINHPLYDTTHKDWHNVVLCRLVRAWGDTFFHKSESGISCGKHVQLIISIHLHKVYMYISLADEMSINFKRFTLYDSHRKQLNTCTHIPTPKSTRRNIWCYFFQPAKNMLTQIFYESVKSSCKAYSNWVSCEFHIYL